MKILRTIYYYIMMRTLIYNNWYDEQVESCVNILFNGDEWSVEEGYYWLKFKSGKLELLVWNANKYYSWMDNGHLKNIETGDVVDWKGGRPSLETMYKIRLSLKKRNDVAEAELADLKESTLKRIFSK